MRELQFDINEWPDVEGSIDMIFGGLGSGKTYAATADILSDLEQGLVVYATWPIDFKGYDERTHFIGMLMAVFGLKYTFYNFDRSNFHYVPLTTPNFMEIFALSTDCIWYVDEAYAVIDSYVKNKMSLEQRFSIYGTRHFNRRLVLVAQRPSSIHVAARAMVNRFYKCERPFPFIQRMFHFTFFVKTEYQDMIDENVDLEKPLSTRWYFGRKSIFQSYNSKYLRGSLERSVVPKIAIYKTNPISATIYLLTPKRKREAALAASQRKPISAPSVPSPVVVSRRITDISRSPKT